MAHDKLMMKVLPHPYMPGSGVVVGVAGGSVKLWEVEGRSGVRAVEVGVHGKVARVLGMGILEVGGNLGGGWVHCGVTGALEDGGEIVGWELSGIWEGHWEGGWVVFGAFFGVP